MVKKIRNAWLAVLVGAALAGCAARGPVVIDVSESRVIIERDRSPLRDMGKDEEIRAAVDALARESCARYDQPARLLSTSCRSQMLDDGDVAKCGFRRYVYTCTE